MGGHRITTKMLHPELRLPGVVMRSIWPVFTLGRFRLCNFLLDNVGRGLPLSSKLHYRQTHIRRGDGSRLRLCLYSPFDYVPGAPALLWLHGGGYVFGIPEQDIFFIRRFVLASGCVVVAPDYTRSETAPYPAALEDCYRALLWTREHCTEYGLSPDRLFVGGDSAGGGLCAALTLLARDRGECPVAFQMPLYPMLDDRMDTPSMRGNDAPVWNERSNRRAWELYLGEDCGGDSVSKYAAPARETDYSGLPPTLSFVGGVDPFRDETERYMDALRAAGVPVTFRVFEGCYHGFDILCGLTPVARKAQRFLMDGFADAIERCDALS